MEMGSGEWYEVGLLADNLIKMGDKNIVPSTYITPTDGTLSPIAQPIRKQLNVQEVANGFTVQLNWNETKIAQDKQAVLDIISEFLDSK